MNQSSQLCRFRRDLALPVIRPTRAVGAGLLLLVWLGGCLETEFLPQDATAAADLPIDAAPDAPQDTATADTATEAEIGAEDSEDAATDATVDVKPDVAVIDVPDTAVEVAAEVDAGPAGLPLGHTCTVNNACQSKLCLTAAEGLKVCSESCNGDCAVGFRCGIAPASGSTTAHYCLPLPGNLCKACTLDSECVGGTCLDLGSGKASVCGLNCGNSGDDCPAGFVCQTFVKGDQCVPMLDTCTCGAETAGKAWGCAVSTQVGKCAGSQTCDGTAWSKCSATVPGPELCDSVDNDCNGQTDETYTSLGTSCGVGVCGGGKLVCAPGGIKLACSTDIKKLKKENCGDGLDNDCNGQSDEGCPAKDVDKDGTPDLADCAPYAAEIYPGAKEACCLKMANGDGKTPVPVTPETKACDANCNGQIVNCAAGDKDGDGVVGPGDCNDEDPLTFPGAKEKCGDGVDQDCSGGDLKCDPTLDVDGDGWMLPADCDDDDVKINPGAAEACNYFDDDCDGIVDEGNPGGGAKCGPDVGACKPGTMVCSHVTLNAQVTCTDAQGGEPESCNGKDDNCDGKTDEEFLDLNKPCDTDDADVCENGKYLCAADGLGVACGAETKTDIIEQCKEGGTGGNSVDDDCDGQTDEVCYGADVDGDGVVGADDCNPLDTGYNPKIKNEACCNPAWVNTSQEFVCDWNCDGKVTPCDAKDLDFDGKTGEEDCNDADPKSFAKAPEKCDDGIDQDCDGNDQECAAISDQDGDGFANSIEQDCKPNDKTINPFATEICNNKDDDCDGVTDEGNPGTTPGACGSSDGQCVPGQEACVHVSNKALILCAPKVGPSAEACNGVDDNCNGKTDEYFVKLGKPCDSGDLDQCLNGTWTCAPDGKTEVCANEFVKDIYELCDTVDNDCDGKTDEEQTYFGKPLGATCKGQGGCGTGVVECSPELQVAVCSTDHYGTASQAKGEACNGIDDDCDGFTDEGMLYGGLPIGASCYGNGNCGKIAGVVECAKGSVNTTGAICSTMLGGSKYQGQKEQCNGVDDNCDGHVDEGMVVADSTCKQVGVCNAQNVLATCKAAKWVCNYKNVAGYQGDAEVFCDAIDNDCDGKADEEFSVGVACDSNDSDQCAFGKVACSQDKLFSECGPESETNLVEACNGKDDDCSGQTDEGFQVGDACDGADKDLCKFGTFVCATDGKTAKCTNETKTDIVEACNGQDDDCDAETDETFTDLTKACDGPDKDSCKKGVFACTTDGKGTVCGTETESDIVEVCDESDNDCDGLTDEDQKYNGAALGGTCNGTGACGSGKVVCSPGKKVATCSTNPDAYLIFDGKELCDGLDNDCNGLVDDALSWKGKVLKEACEGVGACGAGVVQCGSDKQVTCSTLANGSAPQAKAETCNGKDDDCDGGTDDALTVKDSNCLKVGVCASDKLAATCEAGAWKCSYAGVAGFQVDEKLCDGLDNDCDGQTDEGFKVGGKCDSDDSDQCAKGTWTCSTDGAKAECKNETLTNIPEVCDGTDNDCDGLTDEEFLYQGLKLGVDCDGIGACGNGKVVCGKDQIATCSTNPDGPSGQAKAEACNNQDDDCNGKTDDTLKYEGLPVGAPCTGIGECGLGTVVCSATQSPVCSSNPGDPSSQAKTEICDAKDNDCDGKTDEDLDPKKTSCNTTGVCAQALVAQCKEGAWKCIYSCCGFEPKETLCDGKDNDCNGLVDDSHPIKGQPCDGDDPDECKNGTFLCSANQQSTQCSAETGGASPETCNGKEDDCYGKTDEDLGLGEACDGPDPDKCKLGLLVCGTGGGLVCSETKASPEECNGKDDDCDGKADNGFEQKGEKCDVSTDNDTCATGSFQCTAAGTMACLGDYACVQPNTTCKVSASTTLPDQCMCSNSPCSVAQGNVCSPGGLCTCQSQAACGFGKVCQAAGCK